MSSPRSRIVILSGVVLAFLGGVLLLRNAGNEHAAPTEAEPPQNDAPFTPAPLSSRYLNTGSEATYVGNEVCATCHKDQHDSYLLGAHSQALRSTEPQEEPADAEFFHAPSRRWYQVYREGDELRHKESIRNRDGSEFVLHDKPVHWTIGSGRFSLSYLAQDGDFLIESPITWYSSRKQWQMSPGFDQAQHLGFERLAPQGCLICHAGYVTPLEGNSYQPEIQQTSIGCESCHGPGSLHAERQGNGNASPGDDLTIVNPADLDRELAESVCANCHLRGEATVYLRGRTMNDFRPGLLLTNLRLDYGIQGDRQNMEVVGHMEQMRMSRCYTQSTTLTCISCHNPHEHPSAETRLEYYRQTCLECHTSNACGLTLAERHQTDRNDNCVACHMPQTDTDIPHFAFTHHRIGIHTDSDSSSPDQSTTPRELIPFQIPPELPQSERDRALGLAYLEYAGKHPEAYQYYLQTARKLLLAGAKDGETLAGLAVIEYQLSLESAADWADRALAAHPLSSESRVNALIVRASITLEQGKAEAAIRDLREATSLRRMPDYWFLLGRALQQTGRFAEAIEALERAVEIAPQRFEFHDQLAVCYRRAGRPEDADAQEQILEVLRASASRDNSRLAE